MMSTHVPNNCKAAYSYVSTDLREPVQLRIQERGSPPITTPQLFERIVQKVPNRPALVSKDNTTFSYQEYWDKSRQLARAFIRLGLEPRTSCGILAVGCPEWFISQMAVIMGGGVIAGIYTTNSPEACHHVLLNSSATLCIVDDSLQMAKIRSVKHRLPLLKAIIQINAPFADFVDSEEGYHSWPKVEAMGARDDHLEDELKKRLKDLAANECALLIYTSGTVGMPKGVMLSHDNLVTLSESIAGIWEDNVFGHEADVNYLPMNHIAAQVIDFFTMLTIGACVHFADRNALKGTLHATMMKARPTNFFGVPRIYEKFAEKLIAAENELPWLYRLLLSTSRRIVKNYNLSRMEGAERITSSSSLVYSLASRIVAKPKAATGLGNCNVFIVGAAESAVELKEILLGYDIKLIDTYGLSEASGSVTINWDPKDTASCGPPFAVCELKIDNPDDRGNGEICVRGRTVFMGYLGDPGKSRETISDDGWLHTGDLGYLDKKGRVHMTGRIKEIIVTSGGENIPPVRIENLVKQEIPAISNAMLVGDKRKYLTMLLSIKTVIDPETGEPKDPLQHEALEWIRNLGLSYATLSEILAAGPCPKVMRSIQEGIDRANAQAISNAQRVQKFAILPHDFSIKTGELGPTLKLRRSIVLKKYANLIESMYSGTQLQILTHPA